MTSVTPSVPTALTVRSVTTRAVAVPLNFALGTSVTVIRTVPLLLVDLLTEEGIVGHAYLFSYTPAGAKSIALLLAEAVDLIKGQPAKPATVYHMLVRRLALLGVTGPVRMAISALDIALWDAAVSYCETRRAMLLVDPPKLWTGKDLAKQGIDALMARSRNAAVFFPRLLQLDQLSENQELAFVPCGTMAGIFARTDTERGVWKAPAGIDATPDIHIHFADTTAVGVSCSDLNPS